MPLRYGTLGLVGALLASTPCISTPAAAATYQLSIQSQPVDDALNEFARQSGLQVVLQSQEVQGLTASGIQGTYTAQAALERMLANTGLAFEYLDATTVAVRPARLMYSYAGKTASGWDSNDGAPLRLAQVDNTSTQSAVGAGDGQEGTAPESADDTLSQIPQEVVVTGSRIVRKDIEAVSPVSVVSGEGIAERGYIRFEEMLMHVPQLQTYQSETGRAFIDLRGLGPVRSLVLVNGRRLQPGGYGDFASANAADPSLIPPGLIKSVEILTGGASSVYGADAVAGVVNFIMDKEYEGFEIAVGGSAFQHDNRNDFVGDQVAARGEPYASGNSFDGPQYSIDITTGGRFNDGQGHMSAYLGFDESKLLRMQARDYTACALDGSGACSGSFTAGQPNFYFPGLGLDATMQPDGSITAWDGNLSNWGPLLSMRHPAQRTRAGAFINYEINEHAKPYFEFNYMRAKTRNYYDESGTFGLPVDISCSSPLLSADQQETICGPGGLDLGPDDTFNVGIYKRNVEGDARFWAKEYNSWRGVIGLQGDVTGNWRYDVSLLYGNTRSTERGANAFSRPRTINALTLTTDDDGNIVCVSGGDCVPYMLFTPGGITQEALDYITTQHFINGDTSVYVANAYIAGDLPFTLPTAVNRPAVVFGAEYRKETAETLFDDTEVHGDILGRTQASNVSGNYDVKELFAEAAVPLIEDRRFIQDLSAELGLRTSDYNIAGSHDTWKIGLNYRPLDRLKLRGGFNRAVRAPNVIELFLPQSASLWNGSDPCAGANPVFTQEQCARTGVAASRYGLVSADPVGQFNNIVGGNLDLQPESADTKTIGFVFSPMSTMNVTVDYWDIKIDDVIGLVDPQTALTQCALSGEPSLCALIHRAPDGNLWLDLQSGQGGCIQATNANLGMWHFRGVDVGIDYRMPLGSGMMKFDLNGSRALKKFYENVKGVAGSQYSCEGLYSGDCDFPNPKWRHSFEATYLAPGQWTASLAWRYFSAVDNPDVDTGIDDGIGAQSYFDLFGTMRFGEKVSVVAGVNNILDKEPPLVSLNLSTNYFNTVDGYYDMLGRYLHAAVTVKF
jgi:iron complex outermembrane receptor protein